MAGVCAGASKYDSPVTLCWLYGQLRTFGKAWVNVAGAKVRGQLNRQGSRRDSIWLWFDKREESDNLMQTRSEMLAGQGRQTAGGPNGPQVGASNSLFLSRVLITLRALPLPAAATAGFAALAHSMGSGTARCSGDRWLPVAASTSWMAALCCCTLTSMSAERLSSCVQGVGAGQGGSEWGRGGAVLWGRDSAI